MREAAGGGRRSRSAAGGQGPAGRGPQGRSPPARGGREPPPPPEHRARRRGRGAGSGEAASRGARWRPGPGGSPVAPGRSAAPRTGRRAPQALPRARSHREARGVPEPCLGAPPAGPGPRAVPALWGSAQRSSRRSREDSEPSQQPPAERAREVFVQPLKRAQRFREGTSRKGIQTKGLAPKKQII